MNKYDSPGVASEYPRASDVLQDLTQQLREIEQSSASGGEHGARTVSLRMAREVRGSGEVSVDARRTCSVVHGKKRMHVIIPMHGIRDRGGWYQTIEDVFVPEKMLVRGPKLGWYNALKFIWPFDATEIPRRILEQHWVAVLKQFRRPRIYIIAHSFGSFLVFTVMRDNQKLRAERVVLCGSVLKQTTRWESLEKRVGVHPRAEGEQYIVNDCGDADYWPMQAKAATWRYGDAGTFGFWTSARCRPHARGWAWPVF